MSTTEVNYPELALLLMRLVLVDRPNGGQIRARVRELHADRSPFYVGYTQPEGERVAFYPGEVAQVLDVVDPVPTSAAEVQLPPKDSAPVKVDNHPF